MALHFLGPCEIHGTSMNQMNQSSPVPNQEVETQELVLLGIDTNNGAGGRTAVPLKILQEQGSHNANDSKYHQSDICQKQHRVPCIDTFHDWSNHCWPTATMRDLKHGVQSLQEASVQTLVVRTTDPHF